MRPDDPANDATARATDCERVKRRQHALQAQGKCRVCGRQQAPESRSRCPGCLEVARRDEGCRNGKTTVRPSQKGRPMIGNWLDRKHAFEHDQILEDRTVLRLPITRLSRRQWGRVG